MSQDLRSLDATLSLHAKNFAPHSPWSGDEALRFQVSAILAAVESVAVNRSNRKVERFSLALVTFTSSGGNSNPLQLGSTVSRISHRAAGPGLSMSD